MVLLRMILLGLLVSVLLCKLDCGQPAGSKEDFCGWVKQVLCGLIGNVPEPVNGQEDLHATKIVPEPTEITLPPRGAVHGEVDHAGPATAGVDVRWSVSDTEASTASRTAAAQPRSLRLTAAVIKEREGHARSKQQEEARMAQLEGTALIVLAPNNRLRACCFAIVRHWLFEAFITVCIVATSIALALERPTLDPDGSVARLVWLMDWVAAVVFTVELILKVVALGLMGRSQWAYLNDRWNVLDLVVVILGWPGVLLSGGGADVRWVKDVT